MGYWPSIVVEEPELVIKFPLSTLTSNIARVGCKYSYESFHIMWFDIIFLICMLKTSSEVYSFANSPCNLLRYQLPFVFTFFTLGNNFVKELMWIFSQDHQESHIKGWKGSKLCKKNDESLKMASLVQNYKSNYIIDWIDTIESFLFKILSDLFRGPSSQLLQVL